MAKTNYSKVEEALSEGLYRMKVEAILQNKGEDQKSSLHPAQEFIILVQELKWLKKTDPDIYKHIKISKKEIASLDKIIEKRRNSLKDSEVSRIHELLQLVKEYKRKNFPESDDALHIIDENERHRYKRHNVSEKWLPLDVPRQ